MRTYVKDIYNFLDRIAPFNAAMDFDNCGLLVGNMNENVDKVLLSLDITREVVNEAESIGANLIISHHPVIFDPIKKIISNSSVPYTLVNKSINAICAHTNLDMSDGCGVNSCLANALGLKDIQPLSVYRENFYNKIVIFVPKGYEEKVMDAMSKCGAGELGEYSECGFLSKGEGRFKPSEGSNPFVGDIGKKEKVQETKIEMICSPDKTNEVIKAMKKAHPYEEPEYDIFENRAISKKIVCGLIGSLDNQMGTQDFVKMVKQKLDCPGVRYTELNQKIKTVAVCSGAGGDYLDFAIEKGVDAFVTGEIKHHIILKANESGIIIVDVGHFKSEDVVFDNLIKVLSKEFSKVKFCKSKIFTDNIKYL